MRIYLHENYAADAWVRGSLQNQRRVIMQKHGLTSLSFSFTLPTDGVEVKAKDKTDLSDAVVKSVLQAISNDFDLDEYKDIDMSNKHLDLNFYTSNGCIHRNINIDSVDNIQAMVQKFLDFTGYAHCYEAEPTVRNLLEGGHHAEDRLQIYLVDGVATDWLLA